MRAMNLDKLLDLAWVIAEAEARALGSEVIEPMHFLLAALKIIDVDFPSQLETADISSEVWKNMCQDAQKVQQYLDVLPEKITMVRRRIRHRLARTAKPPIPDKHRINREILNNGRTEYGKRVVKGLAHRLMLSHGSGGDEKSLRHSLRNAETIDLYAHSCWTGREAKSKEKSKEKGKEKSVEKSVEKGVEKILKHLYASVGTIGQQVADQLEVKSQGIAQIVQQDAEQLRSPFEPKHRQRRKNRRGRWFCGGSAVAGRPPYQREDECGIILNKEERQ